jgi:ech hydrogenase subunit F
MFDFMIFTKTMLKNLFSKPATTTYPFEPREYPERSRGHIEIDMDNCIFCGMCMRNCPPGAIKVDRKEQTWQIERFDCIQCGYCTEKCPKKCLFIVPGYPEPEPEKTVDRFVKPAETQEDKGVKDDA